MSLDTGRSNAQQPRLAKTGSRKSAAAQILIYQMQTWEFTTSLTKESLQQPAPMLSYWITLEESVMALGPAMVRTLETQGLRLFPLVQQPQSI